MSNTLKKTYGIIVVGVSMLLAAAPAWAAGSTIDVELWDKGAQMEMSKDMGMGMMHAMAGDMAPMGIKVSTDSVPAGEVTFNAKNMSTELIHEMVVAPIADPTKLLPYDATMEKVDEDAAGHLGEVAELDPDAKGSLTLTLKAGTYILYCNLPGHYASGMWTLITVK